MSELGGLVEPVEPIELVDLGEPGELAGQFGTVRLCGSRHKWPLRSRRPAATTLGGQFGTLRGADSRHKWPPSGAGRRSGLLDDQRRRPERQDPGAQRLAAHTATTAQRLVRAGREN